MYQRSVETRSRTESNAARTGAGRAWTAPRADFSAATFLSHTKTFHDLYAPLTTPAIAPILTFLVKWGHLLIGLSLVSGLLVRVSGVFGVALLLTYWTAHMDFPYIETHVNLIIDYHIVYAVLTAWLVAANAGKVYGLDGWIAEHRPFRRHSATAY